MIIAGLYLQFKVVQQIQFDGGGIQHCCSYTTPLVHPLVSQSHQTTVASN